MNQKKILIHMHPYVPALTVSLWQQKQSAGKTYFIVKSTSFVS